MQMVPGTKSANGVFVVVVVAALQPYRNICLMARDYARRMSELICNHSASCVSASELITVSH